MLPSEKYGPRQNVRSFFLVDTRERAQQLISQCPSNYIVITSVATHERICINITAASHVPFVHYHCFEQQLDRFVGIVRIARCSATADAQRRWRHML